MLDHLVNVPELCDLSADQTHISSAILQHRVVMHISTTAVDTFRVCFGLVLGELLSTVDTVHHFLRILRYRELEHVLAKLAVLMSALSVLEVFLVCDHSFVDHP